MCYLECMNLPRAHHARTFRLGAVALLAGIVVLALPLTASAQVVGQGKTARWATLGLVARFDGSGELQYAVAAGINIQCKRFSSYERTDTAGGDPRVELTARKCFTSTGKQRFLHAVFVDRGEPAGDIVRLRWSRAWPVIAASTARVDRGVMSAGNLQIFKVG
jgi:hypothetical protein